MKDRGLLVPGTSGTKLLLNGEDFGWPAELAVKSWAIASVGQQRIASKLGLSAPQIVQALSMEFADADNWFPTKSSLRAGSSLVPGPVLKAAYHQLGDLQPFVYDWRSDIRGSGKKLLRFLRDHKPNGGRFRIVAHSQGGLVVVVASKLAAQQAGDPAAFSQLVSRVVLLATPLVGTQRAACAFVDADSLGDGFASQFRKIALTWPALYQMLPVWRGAIVRPSVVGPPVPVAQSLLSEEAWQGYAVSPELLQRARDTRKEFFRNPLSQLANVKVAIAMAQSWGTLNRVLRDGSGLRYEESGADEPGDTLVPAETTHRLLDDFSRRNVVLFGRARDRSTAQHFMLANDPAVASFCRRFLGL